MKKALSLILALALCLSLCACGSDVKSVIEQIDALNGNITLDSGPFIDKAEAAYNALTDAEKEKVTNYAILVSARGQFDELNKMVADTINLVDALPAPETIQFSDGVDILAAWMSYQLLSEKEKTKVTNLDKLMTAIEIVNKIPAEATLDMFDYSVSLAEYKSYAGEYIFNFSLSVSPQYESVFTFKDVVFQVKYQPYTFDDDVVTVTLSSDGYGEALSGYYMADVSKDWILAFSSIKEAEVISGKVYYNIANDTQ